MDIDKRKMFLSAIKKEFCPEGKCTIPWPEKDSYYCEELNFFRDIYSRSWDELTPEVVSLNYDSMYFLKGELFRYCLGIYIKASLEMECMTNEELNKVVKGLPVYSVVVSCVQCPSRSWIGKRESEIEARYGSYRDIYSNETYLEELNKFHLRFENIPDGQAILIAKYLNHVCITDFRELREEASVALKNYWSKYL